MTKYKYRLEKYLGSNTRYICPACQDRRKTFVRYVNIYTREHIDSTVGRCNRQDDCRYHMKPREYFRIHPNVNDNWKPRLTLPYTPHVQKKVSLFDPEVFKASLKGYESNNFTNYLLKIFGNEIASQLISKYFIGSSKHWQGATVFWQIDTIGKIHAGKIILYDPDSGKRVKQPFNHISWVHSVLKEPDFNLNQCLFGEHLLKGSSDPVAIVESEKTAIIASAYLPQFIWLAVGGKEGLNMEKCQILKGRKVILFPDLGCFESWKEKARSILFFTDFIVSDLLENNASDEDRKNGLDIADYLVKFDYETFVKKVLMQIPSIKSGSANQMKSVGEPNIKEIRKSEATFSKTEETLGSKYETFGDIFDYYKAKGYKALPKNIELCIPGWNYIEVENMSNTHVGNT